MNREKHEDVREAVREVCAGFTGEYWRAPEEQGDYPEDFVRAMIQSGLLGALLPEEYGGSGLGLSAARAILEEVNTSGGTPAPRTPRCTR